MRRVLRGALRPTLTIVFQIDRRDRQRRASHLIREQQHRGAVAQQVLQALRGIAWVQRHVRTARLQHRQQTDHHLRAALHAQPHSRIGADS